MRVRDALKRATRDVHDRLDARLSNFRLDDRDDYREFLVAQATAFLPVERALSEAGADKLVAGWTESRRSSLLAADLAELGVSTIGEVSSPSYSNENDLLGGIYVLEGSRMGAASLARSVPTAFPRRFLSARSPTGHWAALLAMLERKLCSSVGLEMAKASAERTFACFEQAAGIDRKS